MKLTTFSLKGYKIGEKTPAQSTSELLPKHQTPEVVTLMHIIHVRTLGRSQLCDV